MIDCRVSFAEGQDREAASALAEAVLRREGVVVLDDLVDPARVAQVRAEVERAYPDMDRVDPTRNFGPYPGRHTMPLRIADSLGDPAVFLPRVVRGIANGVLGDRFKMDSLGLLVSIAGAPDQSRHADASLFPGEIDRMLPPFAIAYALPLVPMDATSGRTAFWRRSHRTPATADAHDFAPTVRPGSAILWDYRIAHRGLANRGDRSRPVIFAALAREWWIEVEPPGAALYEKLLVARDVHAALDPRLQFRISRARLVD